MSATPLYKSLKTNGTSFYAFPGAAEDISSAYQNQNYKMYFSKYILLNLPKVNTSSSTTASVHWDFYNNSGYNWGFQTSVYATPATDYKSQLIESLRNYVANQEVTIKDSMLNNTEYYYDSTVLSTPTEKVFWKWCKQLNLVDFEQANPGDQYFDNLIDFQSNNLNDNSYFPEILWQERTTSPWSISNLYSSSIGSSQYLGVEFEATTNFRQGDIIEFNGISSILSSIIPDGTKCRVQLVTPATFTTGQLITTDISYLGASASETTGTASLVYDRLVQYIGEVNGINNVQEANRSYTEVYAHIPDQTGGTPDILFRTEFDNNYKPNMVFPILPSQYQPEIIGAEIFSSPIVSNPSSYPGSYYGQFDTTDFTYQTSNGDSLRRSGEYFGIGGTTDVPQVLSNTLTGQSTIDGISIDFDPSHYVKMNIIGQELTNFDQFDALQVNNQPPRDFDFNAILWYYNVEDINGNVATNLYGISFVDNPDNNQVNIGIQVPLFNKFAANDTQDGTSYAFSLDLCFNIINDNPQDTYNPEAINSLFSMNLFNQAMSNLSSVNQSFNNIISSQNGIQTDLMNMKQLLYSQTDFATINSRINNLNNLLQLYSTNQIIDSDTIKVSLDNTTRPPRITLNSIDSTYYQIDDIMTSNLYNVNGAIPYLVNVPENKNFLVYVENNDTTNFTLPNNDKLTIVLSSDLSFKQSCDIIIDATLTGTQNKQLEVYIMYKLGDDSNQPVETQIIDTIDLPIYYNSVIQGPNSASKWDKVNFSIDLNNNIQLNTGGILEVPILGNYNLILNSFQNGDTLLLNDFSIGTVSQIDFSGQYTINSVGATNSYIYLDVNNNSNIMSYGASSSLPLSFNSNANTYLLSNYPYLSLNKGVKYKITRVSESNQTSLSDRYLIEKEIQ